MAQATESFGACIRVQLHRERAHRQRVPAADAAALFRQEATVSHHQRQARLPALVQ